MNSAEIKNKFVGYMVHSGCYDFYETFDGDVMVSLLILILRKFTKKIYIATMGRDSMRKSAILGNFRTKKFLNGIVLFCLSHTVNGILGDHRPIRGP